MRNSLPCGIFWILVACQYVEGFLAPQISSRTNSVNSGHQSTQLFTLQQESEEKTLSINDEAARLRKEAEMIRLQAEKMDLSLTLEKINQIEAKLENKKWLEKNPEKELELQTQLQSLNYKLQRNESPDEKKIDKPEMNVKLDNDDSATKMDDSSPSLVGSKSVDKYAPIQTSEKKKKTIPKIPLAGFDDSDLELYIPIAKDIDKMIPNATIEEKLESFRTAPELQAHFQEKIKKMLVGPLEEMQQLETLKKDYLDSTSSKERESLKRVIERLEAQLEDDTPFLYSESFYCEDLTPLSEEELALRMEAVGSLPDILKSIYKQRNGLDEKDDLSLAIEMDYYEPQLQLLEQAGFVDPFTDDMSDAYYKGYNSLPPAVKERFCRKNGIEAGANASEVLAKIQEVKTPTSSFMEVVQAASDLPEYNDIDFVDRSRFLEEFYPSIGNMEGDHPSLADVEKFSSEVLDRRYFMVTSKPERVAGGYYIRGQNQLSGDEDGVTAADKLVKEVSKQLEKSDLGDKLDFFYILDPSPPTDEEIEFGPVDRPLFVLTSKDPKKLYAWSKPATKALISFGGLVTTFLFSVGACALNPSISDRFTNMLDAAATSGVIDLQWFVELFVPIFGGALAIQLAHEVAHFLVALRYKFDVGLPNLIPSVTTGLTGAITPLKSPPPNTKALFDFAIAGPVAGLFISIILLLQGLEITSSMDMNAQLPVLPVDLIRASSLGGGMVQFFLGNAAVMPDQGPAAMIELHPLAIAGFMGCITNSLALLPLGHTDGGRIAVAMFGRRGAFVVKLFTTLLLCAAGIFGLDDVNILLTYVLFASIWQRELESPVRNEVDELDFMRGLFGISAAIMVGLTLIPMF